jgi:hypothetical protein
MDRAEFFKVPLYAEPSNYEDTKERFNNCTMKKCGLVIINGFFYTCCLSPSIQTRLLHEPEGTDGIPLEGITEEKIQAFVNRQEPINACYRCRAYQGRQYHWHEVEDKEQWLKESME